MKKLVARLAALVLTIGTVGPAAAQLLPPLPGGSLVVTLTSPSNGSTVSGTVPVSAGVSIVGSLTVSRVEFFRDGNFIGSDSGAPYSVSWNTTTVSNGSHTLSAVAVDVLGVRWTSNSVTVTVSNGPPPDTTPPTVAMTSPAAGATVSGTIKVSANASDNVGIAGVQFKLDDINNNLGAEERVAPYEISWDTTTVSNGQHTIAAVARDAAGNRTTSAPVTFTVANDKTTPTVSINQAAGQADPTSSSPINFTAVFSEPVSGFTGSDVSIGGTAGGTKTVSVTGGPSTYNVAVSGMTSGGTVIATIPSGRASDAAGNTNTASTSTDNSVTWVPPDTTRPSVTINQAADQADPTSASPIKFTVVFSESVSGFSADDVTISGTAGGTKTVTLTCGSNTYCVEVRGMTTGGTVIASIAAGVATDAAGNSNTASTSTDNTVTWVPPDTTRPSVTINQAAGQADPTSASPILFTAVFSEPVSGFTGTDVSIGGTAGATTATVSGGPSTYTVAVSGMTSSGTVSVAIPAGGASDAAGNTNSASTSTDNSVTFNTTPPAPTIASFSPTSGPAATVVTISGTNLNGTTAVAFNGVSAGFIVDSDTSIRTQVPAGATTGPISVTTPGGTATSPGAFTVEAAPPPPAPTITSFTPTSGPVGTSVTITGTGFTGATAAAFNGVPVTTASVDSDTSITATVPSGATTGPISVTTPGGTATSSTSFTVTTVAPTIISFSPTSGPVGTSVTITGTGFTGATAAAFNGVPVTTASVVSDTTITATVPSGATTGPISVTTPGGTATSASAFTVEAAPTTGRFEETDPAVSASPAGAWVLRGAEIAAFSGGTAGVSDVTGATVTFTFSGTAVSWIGLRCNVCGIATVSIDGGAATSVDTAGAAAPGSPGLASESVFTASGLAAGTTHTLVITVTGNTNSGGAFIIVDAFDVTGDGSAAITSAASAATRIEDSDPAVSYTGTGWTPRDSLIATFSGGAALSSAIAGDTSSFTFTGSAVSWIGVRCSVCGIATVSIDGVTHGEVDTASAVAPGSAELASQAVFTASGLAPDAAHTLVIRVTGTTTSGGAHIAIDAFDVTP